MAVFDAICANQVIQYSFHMERLQLSAYTVVTKLSKLCCISIGYTNYTCIAPKYTASQIQFSTSRVKYARLFNYSDYIDRDLYILVNFTLSGTHTFILTQNGFPHVDRFINNISPQPLRLCLYLPQLWRSTLQLAHRLRL